MNRQTTQVQVYYLLRRALSSGELKPGRKIQEEQLAQQFNVSRTPLREAISRLAQDGLIVSIPFRGVFVREYTLSEIQQLYEMRSVLEAFSVRAACRRASEEELTGIVALLEETERVIGQKKELTKLLEANKNFHMAVALSGKNDWLCSALENLHAHFGLLRVTNLQHSVRQQRALRDHRDLVHALLARDEDRAADLVQEHLRHAWEFTYAAYAEASDELEWEIITVNQR